MLDDHHNNNSHHSNHHVYVLTINLFQQLFTTSPRETPRSSAVSTKVVALEVAWNSKRSPGMRLFRCVWCLFFLWKQIWMEKKIGLGTLIRDTPDVYQFPPPGFPTLKTTCVLSAVLLCHSKTSMFQKERKRKVGLGDWQIFGFVSSFINVNKQHGTSTLGIARIAILFHIHPLHQVAQASVSASSSRRFRNSSNRFWLDSDKLERSPFLGGEQNSG